MAIFDQHFPENTLRNIKKFLGYTQKESTQKGNDISFWAFLLSPFIYISIFYLFNLSPSSVLNTTKFWFFISNTLILIIAADFGAFSLSRKQEDPYYEYVKTSEKNNLVIVGSQYREIVNKTIPLVKVDNSREEIKEIVQVDDCETKPLENNLQIILKKDFKKLSEKCREDVPPFARQSDKDFKSCNKIVRTISKLSVQFNDLEDKTIICQNEPENYDKEEGDGEESEFSRMSNEELNRRVEEFIRRSNRQIRLQAIQNKFNKYR